MEELTEVMDNRDFQRSSTWAARKKKGKNISNPDRQGLGLGKIPGLCRTTYWPTLVCHPARSGSVIRGGLENSQGVQRRTWGNGKLG